jgi:hypothetical protein
MKTLVLALITAPALGLVSRPGPISPATRSATGSLAASPWESTFRRYFPSAPDVDGLGLCHLKLTILPGTEGRPATWLERC